MLEYLWANVSIGRIWSWGIHTYTDLCQRRISQDPRSRWWSRPKILIYHLWSDSTNRCEAHRAVAALRLQLAVLAESQEEVWWYCMGRFQLVGLVEDGLQSERCRWPWARYQRRQTLKYFKINTIRFLSIPTIRVIFSHLDPNFRAKKGLNRGKNGLSLTSGQNEPNFHNWQLCPIFCLKNK